MKGGFDFIAHFNQYSKEGIEFKIFEDQKTVTRENIDTHISENKDRLPKEEIELAKSRIGSITGIPKIVKNIDKSTIERFYKRRLLEDNRKDWAFETFMHDELAFLNSLPEETKSEYKFQINALENYLHIWKKNGGFEVKTESTNKSVNDFKYSIKDFENFIYGFNGILENTLFDLIKWEPNYILTGTPEKLSRQEQSIFESISEDQRKKNLIREAERRARWEQISFYATGTFKTAEKVWCERSEDINLKAHLSKTNIKHIIYVEKNTPIIEYLKNEIEKICERIEKFKDTHNMFHGDIMFKNHWFLSLWTLVIGYKEWFYDLIKPLEKVLSPEQNHTASLNSDAKLNAEKIEQLKGQDSESENRQKKDYELYIDRNYNYSPNIEDFKEKAQIIKLKPLPDYLLFLREAKEKYGNAKFFYTLYGDGTHSLSQKSESYETITNFIKDEITNELPKANEKSINYQPPKSNTDPSKKEPTINIFDYSNTENYFFPDKIESLKQVEREMTEKGYLKETGEWHKEKISLVAFIYILYLLAYLRPKISGKEKKASLLAYRRFFEARYKTDISAQMKPSKFKIGTLKNYKPDFIFISGIDNL